MAYKKVLVTVLAVLVVGGLGFLAYTNKGNEPELTREAAISTILLTDIGDDDGETCKEDGVPEVYNSCKIEISKGEGVWNVRITYDGFFDDSVKASRLDAVLAWENGEWVIRDLSEKIQCWPDRGHQDFSSELCV